MQENPLIDSKSIRGLVDPCLSDEYNVQVMICVVFTSALCVQQSIVLRPCMGHVSRIQHESLCNFRHKNIGRCKISNIDTTILYELSKGQICCQRPLATILASL